MIEEDKKFLKLLELLGHYQERGSVIIFVDKQEHADGLLKDLMKASYPCMSLHGGEDILESRCRNSGCAGETDLIFRDPGGNVFEMFIPSRN